MREDTRRLVVRGEQGVETGAEGNILTADGLKEGRPFGDGLLKGQREQRGLSFLGRWHG